MFKVLKHIRTYLKLIPSLALIGAFSFGVLGVFFFYIYIKAYSTVCKETEDSYWFQWDLDGSFACFVFSHGNISFNISQ